MAFYITQNLSIIEVSTLLVFLEFCDCCESRFSSNGNDYLEDRLGRIACPDCLEDYSICIRCENLQPNVNDDLLCSDCLDESEVTAIATLQQA
jgi:hypothetical protein